MAGMGPDHKSLSYVQGRQETQMVVCAFFIPLLNIAVIVKVWMDIARVRDKSAWLGILTMIPIINIFVPAYLALSD